RTGTLHATVSAERIVRTGVARVVQDMSHTGSGCCVVDNLAVDDGEDGPDLFDVFIRHREVILVEHGEIRKLAGFDGTNLIFHPKKPTVAERKQTQHLLPGDLLIAIHALSK